MNKKILFITTAALIAALYAVLTYLFSSFGLSFGVFQLRFSEALMALAVFTPAAIPGLAIGCFISNIASPFGVLDIILGTSATLIASVCMWLLRNIKFKKVPFIALFMPVLSNTVFLPFVFILAGASGNFFEIYFTYAFYILIEETLSCFIPGIILFAVVKKLKFKHALTI